MKRLVAILFLVAASAAPAFAQQRTWNFLTTGNGYGFQVFDTNANNTAWYVGHDTITSIGSMILSAKIHPLHII